VSDARTRLGNALPTDVLMHAAVAARQGDGAEMRRRLVTGMLNEDPSIGRDLTPHEHEPSAGCWCRPIVENVEPRRKVMG
jgi:hypothetical protein